MLLSTEFGTMLFKYQKSVTGELQTDFNKEDILSQLL